ESCICRGSRRITTTRVRQASLLPRSRSSAHSTPGAPGVQRRWWASDAEPSQRDGEASRRHHVFQPLAVATASVSAQRPVYGRTAAVPVAPAATRLSRAVRSAGFTVLLPGAAGHLDSLHGIGDGH
ncbi:MAG: hypothetical protein ACJ8AP_06225, partial [Gemmatimonadales bacterium]